MLSFKQYNLQEEVVASRRQGITHFDEMKPLVFIDWIKHIKVNLGGILSNIKTVMKLDGLGARFGKDSSGRVFFEGSRTGPIFEPGAFTSYATANGSNEEVILRAKHYDDMLSLFQSADMMSALPNNSKVVCEIMYNPLASIEGDGIKFVSVTYDKKKLGSVMSIFPYALLYADSGLTRHDEGVILEQLYKKSNQEIKVLNPNLKMGSIDINGLVDSLKTLADVDLVSILGSRKAADAPAKANALTIINTMKKSIAEYLLTHPAIHDKFMISKDDSKEIEGIVIHLPSGVYKITTPAFRAAHSRKGQ